MPGQINYLYWDSNVFLSYLNRDAQRLPAIDALLAEVLKSNEAKKIATSVLTITEVAFVRMESDKGAIDPAIEAKIDAFWRNSAIVEIVEFHEVTARCARTLMRKCIANNLRVLDPPDAIHLATALLIGAQELHTYNEKHFLPYQSIVSIKICQPYCQSPTLPGI